MELPRAYYQTVLAHNKAVAEYNQKVGNASTPEDARELRKQQAALIHTKVTVLNDLLEQAIEDDKRREAISLIKEK